MKKLNCSKTTVFRQSLQHLDACCPWYLPSPASDYCTKSSTALHRFRINLRFQCLLNLRNDLAGFGFHTKQYKISKNLTTNRITTSHSFIKKPMKLNSWKRRWSRKVRGSAISIPLQLQAAHTARNKAIIQDWNNQHTTLKFHVLYYESVIYSS